MNHERNCLEEMKTAGIQEPNFSLNEEISNIETAILQSKQFLVIHKTRVLNLL